MNIKSTKPKASKSKRFLSTAIVFGLISVAIFGVFLYAIQSTKKEVQVPVSKVEIRKGDKIEPDDIKLVSIGRLGLIDNMIDDPNIVVGKYALRDYAPDEYFFATSLTADYVKTLQEKVRYGGMAVSISNIAAANGEIKENDFIKIYSIMKNRDPESSKILSVSGEAYPRPPIQLFNPPELGAVRVVGVYDATGKSIEMAKERVLDAEKKGLEELGNAEAATPNMIMLDLLPIQQVMLLQSQYGGQIHAVVLPKEVQDRYRRIWGLIDEDGEPVVDDKEWSEKDKEKLEKDHLKLQEDTESEGLSEEIENSVEKENEKTEGKEDNTGDLEIETAPAQ